MVERRIQWENLHIDFLTQIFKKTGRKSVMSSAQLVCKSWFQASLSCNLWNDLDLSFINYGSCPDTTCLIKLDISTSSSSKRKGKGNATRVILPETLVSSKALNFMLDACPNINILVFPIVPFNFEQNNDFKTMFGRMKNLEALELGYCSNHNFWRILSEIGSHCKYWDSLSISHPRSTDLERNIKKEEAMAIVELVSKKIKCLNFTRCRISRESLVMIIRRCKKLIRLDVRDCVGFDVGDKEILKLASGIRNFLV